jgi:hypothetical protein
MWSLYSSIAFVCSTISSWIFSSVNFFFKKGVVEKTTEIIKETLPVTPDKNEVLIANLQIIQVLLENLDRKVAFINKYLKFVGLSKEYNPNSKAGRGLTKEIEETLSQIVKTQGEIAEKVNEFSDLITPHVETISEVVSTLTNL